MPAEEQHDYNPDDTEPDGSCECGNGRYHPCHTGSPVEEGTVQIEDPEQFSVFMASALLKYALQPEVWEVAQKWAYQSQLDAGNPNPAFINDLTLDNIEYMAALAVDLMYAGLRMHQNLVAVQEHIRAALTGDGPGVTAVSIPFSGLSSLFGHLTPPDVEGGPAVDTGTNGPVE